MNGFVVDYVIMFYYNLLQFVMEFCSVLKGTPATLLSTGLYIIYIYIDRKLLLILDIVCGRCSCGICLVGNVKNSQILCAYFMFFA